MDYDKVSSGNYGEEEGFDSRLEAAAAESRRVLEAIQALAGTAACKGVQIASLKKWAVANRCWIKDTDALGKFSDRGSENEVYISDHGNIVFKLNDFRYADDNLEPFIQRISIHNILFSDCSYHFEGLAENHEGKICAVISQPFIRADREASIEEIAGALALMGFMPQQDGEYFSDGRVDIFDAVPNNVLHGIDGNLYFIDTLCLPSSDNYLEVYKSLSPNWSKPRR